MKLRRSSRVVCKDIIGRALRTICSFARTFVATSQVGRNFEKGYGLEVQKQNNERRGGAWGESWGETRTSRMFNRPVDASRLTHEVESKQVHVFHGADTRIVMLFYLSTDTGHDCYCLYVTSHRLPSLADSKSEHPLNAADGPLRIRAFASSERTSMQEHIFR
jgi:hypothetical protein